MNIDLSAAQQFIAYLEGQADLQRIIEHPAYQAVWEHARCFGNGLTIQDVQKALRGEECAFYGLGNVRQNLPGIKRLMEVIRENIPRWIEAATCTLAAIVDTQELAGLTVYPIIGYDIGIGLDGVTCQNLNCQAYLKLPDEFLYYMIHECVHVLYERRHHVPDLAEMKQGREWDAYFSLWMHNEGFAVYAPLHLRQQNGHMQDRDYQALSDPARTKAFREAYRQARAALRSQDLPENEALDLIFGDQRLTYRAGCDLLRQVEAVYGAERVRQAFEMDAGEFVKNFGNIISPSCFLNGNS